MPFKSKAQMRWMFENDPEMAMKWFDETKSVDNLPEKIRKQRKQRGGVNISRFLPNFKEDEMTPPVEEISGFAPIMQDMYEAPALNKEFISNSDYKGPLINQSTTPGMTIGPKQHDWETRETQLPKKEKWDPYFAMKGTLNGLSWLSGMTERGRQDQYSMNQMSTLGQIDPSPVEDFQPNPFSMYARFGGSLKKYQAGGRLVDQVPEGYRPYPELGPNYYHNPQSSSSTRTGGAQMSNETWTNFLNSPQGLTYKQRQSQNSDDIVYTQSQQQPMRNDQPAYGAQGQPVYRPNRHIAGEIFYPNRNSDSQSDAGVLNTAQQNARLKFRNDFGYTGEETELTGPEIQQYLGTTNTFGNDDLYNQLKSRAAKSTVSKMKKGGKYRGKC